MSSSRTHHSDTKRNQGDSIGELFTRGFYILMPLMLIGLIGQKLIQMLQEFLSPVLDRLPGVLIQNATVRFVLLCVVVAGFLVLVGFLARRRVGRTIGDWLETRILNKLPFYSRLRGLSSTLSASNDDPSMGAARITVDAPGLEQLGVILERHDDGSATVFLPGTPNPSAGTVIIVGPDRIRELTVPVRSIVGCMGRYGAGTAELLKGADLVPPPAANPAANPAGGTA